MLSMVLSGCPAGQIRHPDPSIEDAFSVGSPFTGAHHGHITLQRHALGRAFMVLPTLMASNSTPMPHLMVPKVVSFELQGSKLAMLERNLEAVYSELPSIKLLQTFDVTDETDESVTFNWHMGLESVPQQPGYAVSDSSDDSAEAMGPHEPLPPLRVRSSFLRSAKIVDNGLELEQLSRLEPVQLPEGSDSEFAGADSVIVRARIVPYEQSESFQPRTSAMLQGVGYFEVAPTAPGQGRPQVLAMRWDTSPKRGPVTYRVSRNTPPQFVQAVAEGVRYWNRVAGRELVRVELDADPEAAIGDHQVMIHWVNWQGAASAYGEIQADPITGEMLHGTIFLPSAFTQLGPRALESVDALAPNALQPGVAPRSFAAGRICNHPHAGLSPTFYDSLKNRTEASERATADALRAVVAHEVGHTLGLRHNHAASGQTSLPDAASLRAELALYATQPRHPGAITASSVMDYLHHDEMVLQGAAIRHQALSYDVAAVRWGYEQAPVQVRDLNVPPFCTDREATQRVLGCDQFDSGTRPLASYAHTLRDERAHLGARLAQELLRSPQPPSGAKPAIAYLSDLWTRAAIKLFGHLADGASVLEVKRAMGPQRLLNPKGYKEAVDAALATAADEVEGLPGMLAAAYPMDANHAPVTGWLLSDTVRALRRAGVSEPACEAVRQSFAPSAEALEQAMLTTALNALTGAYQLGSIEDLLAVMKGQAPQKPAAFLEEVVRPSWESVLAEMGRHIVLDTKTQDDLPQPRFSHSARLAGVRLFSGKVFGAADWAQAQRTQLMTDLNQRRETEALRPLMGTASKGTAERTEWLRQELEVIGALSALNP